MSYDDDIWKIATYVHSRMGWLDFDDVYQECYLAAMFYNGKDLSCNFSVAVRRDVMDVFRGRKWRDVLPKGRRHLAYVVMPRPKLESPEDDYIERIHVDQLMELLSDKSRELLIDRYWNELTTYEIAEREGVVRSAISKRYTRIVQELRNA